MQCSHATSNMTQLGGDNEICMHAVDNDMAKPLGNIIIVISINAITSLHLLKEEDACKFL